MEIYPTHESYTWILLDDNVTERKLLLGQSDEGYHFGHIDGWPDSVEVWNSTSYATEELAAEAQVNFMLDLAVEDETEAAFEYCSALDLPNLHLYEKSYIDFLEVPF